MPSFAREVITRLRYPQTAGRGGVLSFDYAAIPAETEIRRCWLEPAESREVNDNRLAALTGYRVAAPRVDVRASDHIRYLGTVYEVVGDVLAVPSPTGKLNYSAFSIKRWEG